MSNNGNADDAAKTNKRPERIIFETSVIENAPSGALVESLQNRFPELTDFRLAAERRQLPFHLTEDGELTVAQPDQLNFEDRKLWVLTVKARSPRTEDRYLNDFLQSLAEASGNSKVMELEQLRYQDVALSIRVQVIDQEESPRVSDAIISINPNSNLKKLGRVVPSEYDLGDALKYSLTCSTSDAFHVDATTGIVSVAHPDQFDWTQSHQAIEIEVADSHGNSARSVIEFNITKPTIAPTLAPTELANASTADNDQSSTVTPTSDDSAHGDTELEELSTRPSPDIERSIAKNSKSAQSEKTSQGGPNSIQTKDRKTSANSYGSGPRRSALKAVEGSRAHIGKKSAERAAADVSGSSRNLNDAARTIGSAVNSSTALNEVLPDASSRKGATKATAPDPRTTTTEAGTSALQQPLPRASIRPVQVVLLILSMTACGFLLYQKYKKARQERLEALKQATSESEARLDQYMNAQNRSDEESLPEEIPPSENVEPSKSVAKASTADRDFDADAPFDPESLIDDALLAEDPRQASEAVSASAHDDSLRADLLTHRTSADSLTPSTAAPASPFVLLDESFLADEILAPRSAEHEQLVFESLQRQLDRINEKFDALHIDSSEAQEESAELETHDDIAPAGFVQLHASASAYSDSNAAECPQATSFTGTAELESEQVLDQATSESSTADEAFEPAYELQWDPELQRYVKVEKAAELDVLNGRGNSIDDRYPSEDSFTSDRSSNNNDPRAAANDYSSSQSSVACMDDAISTETDDHPSERVMSLRAELADLFNLHVATTSQNRIPSNEPTTPDDQAAETSDLQEKSPEESHLDSVAKYLSQLLERSRKEDNADIFVERRGGSSGKWDGVDRRQKPKPVVKSYIESYLEQHGGQLHEDIQELAQRTQELAAPPEEPRPVRERKPIDVTMLRKNMESFRAVAERSVESAMASYKVRQAKGRLVGRSMLITGLIVVVGLGIGTNVFHTFHLEPLNWLMCSFILLCVAEFFLRVESIRKHRREMRLRILSAQTPAQKNTEIEVPALEIVQPEPLPEVGFVPDR